jgi:hypothetical protein
MAYTRMYDSLKALRWKRRRDVDCNFHGLTQISIVFGLHDTFAMLASWSGITASQYIVMDESDLWIL